MKKILSLLLLLLPVLIMAQEGFTVKAKFDQLGTNKVKASYYKNGKYTNDTLVANKKGVVLWEGKVDEPQIVRMEVLDSSLILRVGKAASAPPFLMFVLTNAAVTITGDAKEAYAASIKSKDKEIADYEVYRKDEIAFNRATWEIQKELNRKLNAKDTAGNAVLMAKLAVLRKENQQTRMRFIDAHPASFSSILMLTNLFLVMSNEDMYRRYSAIDQRYKDTKAYTSLGLKVESNRRTAIGQPMIQFSLVGVDGKQVNTADLKGKVVLLDFWGSWCVPCRKSHPALKALYAKYKSKGLEIVGISNEAFSAGKTKQQQIDSWKTAIKEDGIDWLHVLNDAEINDLAKSHDINGYPTKFLIDRNGKFILKILGTSEALHKTLEAKLAELMPD